MKLILSIILAIAVVLSQSPTVQAWGMEGHGLTGELARKLMDTKTIEYVERIAPDFNSGNWSYGSTWADSRGRFKYPWSSPLHYTDSDDDPPEYCEYVDERVCADDNCITGALTNFTDQLLSCETNFQINDATKFLIHFIGDLHQPLHASGKARGGNDIIVKFGRRNVKLHRIWDTELVRQRIKDFGTNQDYLNYLYTKINNGGFNLPVNLPKGRNSIGHYTAYTAIAEHSNSLVCPFIYKYADGKTNFKDELPDIIYDIIDQQLASAAFMIAKVLKETEGACKPIVRARRPNYHHQFIY